MTPTTDGYVVRMRLSKKTYDALKKRQKEHEESGGPTTLTAMLRKIVDDAVLGKAAKR